MVSRKDPDSKLCHGNRKACGKGTLWSQCSGCLKWANSATIRKIPDGQRHTPVSKTTNSALQLRGRARAKPSAGLLCIIYTMQYSSGQRRGILQRNNPRWANQNKPGELSAFSTAHGQVAVSSEQQSQCIAKRTE